MLAKIVGIFCREYKIRVIACKNKDKHSVKIIGRGVMKTVYKIFLALNATLLMLLVYLIKDECWIFNLGSWSIIIYAVILLIYTRVCIAMRFCLKKAGIEKDIEKVSILTDGHVTTFLGLFFVALSIPTKDYKTFCTVFLILNIFLYNSQTIYFNPLLCLFGYNFYEIYTKLGTRVYIITQEKNIKGTSELEFPQLRKINEFTYIDEEKKNGLFVGKGKR